MSVLDVPGARLYYEIRGSGPLLVMIAGANGVADGFRTVAGHLGEHHTVLIYDRRGFSRSRLDGPQDCDSRLETDADDVRRLVEHVDDQPATVFGTSSGGLVASEVLTRHPSVVRALIPYEPPAMRLLRDGRRWVGFFHDVYDLYRRSGIDVALETFRERAFVVSDRQVMARAPRNERNATYWFEHELRQYPAVDLDLAALTVHADRIMLAVGQESRGYPAYEATAELGRMIRRDMAELPGGHVGFVSRPAEYARDLVLALQVSRQSG